MAKKLVEKTTSKKVVKKVSKNKKTTSTSKKIDFTALKKYLRVVNYISAAQLYLQDNFFLERELRESDLKNTLVGHWGGATGVNFFLTHLNFYLKNHQKSNPRLRDIMFILGPGHAFPALQANMFLDKTLSHYYSSQAKKSENIFDFNVTYDKEGLGNLIKYFGYNGGFPTHASPYVPGVILEGGELGYSMSNASGAVLDNPDLITVNMIGDGEAETASLATSWHISKFIDSKTNGVVLPVLNLNSYKISNPTVFARMSDQELTDFFRGLSYEPIIIDAASDTRVFANRYNCDLERDEVHILMQEALDKAFKKILELKKSGETRGLPVIILKSDKGWTGPKYFDSEKIEGNWLSHTVPLKEYLKKGKVDERAFKLLESWLKSYKINELFSPKYKESESLIKKRLKVEEKELFLKEIEDIVPEKLWRFPLNSHIQQFGKGKLRSLKLPKLTQIFKHQILLDNKDWHKHSPMNIAGVYMRELFELNEKQKNFRFFSPDETYSNKLDPIFQETTRGWLRDIRPWEFDLGKKGRVIEVLSENNLLGMMMGYTLTGRHAFFATYEAFAMVAVSMVDQYLKFLRGAQNVPWRGDLGNFNMINTSSLWTEQDNGFSHENPGFMDDMLVRNSSEVNVYLPMDAVACGYAMEAMCTGQNQINLLSSGKDERPLFLSEQEARRTIAEGVMILETFSDHLRSGEKFDLIVGAAGDYVSEETLAGLSLINQLFQKYKLEKKRKNLKLGFLNISHLNAGDIYSEEKKDFNKKLKNILGKTKSLVSFNGHPQTLEHFFYEAGISCYQTEVRGFIGRGGIFTILQLHMMNKTSRYDVANWLTNELFKMKKIDKLEQKYFLEDIAQERRKQVKYIKENNLDSPEVKNWQFTE